MVILHPYLFYHHEYTTDCDISCWCPWNSPQTDERVIEVIRNQRKNRTLRDLNMIKIG